jgi:branched-chain amino acid transport system substrate-binding protein
MQRRSIRLLTAVAILSVLAAPPVAARLPAGTRPGLGDGKLVIASLAPETGMLTPLLASLRVPVEIAVEEINAAGGVNGQAVGLVTGDEGDDASTARATVDRFAGTDAVDAIEGPAAPATTISILGTIKKTGMLMCSGSDTLAPVSVRQSNGLYFRTAPPSRLEGLALAELVLSDAHRRVAIIRRDDLFGASVSETLEQGLRAGGAKIVGSVAYDPERPSVEGVAGQTLTKKPDAIVVIGFDTDGATVVKTLIAQHAGPQQVGLYAPDTMQSNDFAAAVDPADHSQVAGLEGTAPAPAPFNVKSPFHAAFAARGIDPIFSSHYYDCTILTALAAMKAKSDNPNKMKRAFTKNLTGKEDCNTFAACKALLERGQSIHWRGASSNFERFGAFEPEEGVYDTWTYDAAGLPITSPQTSQIHVAA